MDHKNICVFLSFGFTFSFIEIPSFVGPFKAHEYGLVILPMTVIKRFHDCLVPTHDAVLKKYEEVKHLAVIDGFLQKASLLKNIRQVLMSRYFIL